MTEITEKNLTPYITEFFRSLTDNEDVIKLAAEIQKQAELGHTAIRYNKKIEHELISEDGNSGYLVIRGNKAGFRRYFNQEKYIFNEFNSTQLSDVDEESLYKAVNDFTEDTIYSQNQIDWQWQASLAFFYHKRFILSGGPGTGKTTTIIRMLSLYLHMFPDNKIALAAPTGKAANRMISGIQAVLEQNQFEHQYINRFPAEAQTIHRLLSYSPKSNTVKYNQDYPLPYDLLIIDESSMLDVSMTSAILKALKPDSQLILIGDKNQLPAVETGNIFSNLCESLNRQSSETNLLLNILNKNEKESHDVENYIELKKNYRFDKDSVISDLCNNTINGDEKKFISCKNHPDFNLLNPKTINEKLDSLQNWYQSLPDNSSRIILSAINYGDNSVFQLNALSRKILHEDYDESDNMPVLVTKNDYNLGIYNGDIGFMQQRAGKWYACFNISGKPEAILLSAINEWQLAHAISIHKSQGSEYDHILITIPEKIEKDFINNQLLYTAISRAKNSVTIWSNEETISKIISRTDKRITFFS